MDNEYFEKLPCRRSIRLKEYDYSRVGLYFITICTQNHEKLFGNIVNGKMLLNDAGKMIEKLWCGITNDFHRIRLHEFVVMPPNHIHGIIEITVGADSISARDNMNLTKRGEIDSPPTGVNIPKIIQSFKRYTTIEYIKMVKKNIVPPFDKRIWQRNYYDHIIRNEKSYIKITEYILNNPSKWSMDEYHI